jgi:carboxypeptidase A2
VIEKLYVASGSSPDHVYGAFNTPIAFTYEFRTGKGTESRFILPADEIVPNSEEVFDSLLAMIQKSKDLGYFKTIAEST